MLILIMVIIMSIYNIGTRTIIVLVFLFILTKLMGKKQLNEASILDYIIGITIGSIAADISLDIEKNILAGLLSLSLYAIISVITSKLSINNNKVNKIINGNYVYLIKNGKILQDNLKKEGITILELQSSARGKNIYDISKVKDAILETSGIINFNLNNDIPINIIVDGKVQEDNLKTINKDYKWLKQNLNTNIENIILMTIDKKNKVSTISK